MTGGRDDQVSRLWHGNDGSTLAPKGYHVRHISAGIVRVGIKERQKEENYPVDIPSQ